MQDDVRSSREGRFRTDSVFPIVYAELRRIAASRLAQGGPQSLQPTELVNEAYLRLGGGDAVWNSRGHFFSAATEAMRRILVERARSRRRLKRGGGRRRIELGDLPSSETLHPLDLLAVDQALTKLERKSPRHAELVKLRFFAGLTIAESAEALGVSTTTVDVDWAYAKTWLKVELEG